MKKFVTLMLVALVAISTLFVLVACEDPKPLENEGEYYILAGGQPGWGLEGVAPTDESVAPRLMKAIALNDEKVASIKDQLKDIKYLYAIDYKYEGEAGWTNEFVLTEGAEAVAIDGNCLVKVIKYSHVEEDGVEAWTPTWYSSPEAGGAVKSLTPDTLWEPQFAENPTDGTSGWNSNGVLLKGVGEYTIVFAEFNNGTYGIAAIQK